MKNKAKVEIKVGQEWGLNNGNTAFPLAYHEGGCLCYVPFLFHDRYRNYASTCFRTLISDPIWGDMSAHTIVTDEQWELYKIPDCAQYFCLFTKPLNGLHGNWERSHPTKDWAMFDYWRVPADFTAWELVEPKVVHCMLEGKTMACDATDGISTFVASEVTCPACKEMISDPVEPEKLQYKLFEIDWTDSGPTVFDVGELIFAYRMIGYTDDPDCVDTNEIINDAYPKQPCDHTGNRKFAIGKLEA